MLLVKVAKVGACYLRFVESDAFNTKTIWKIVENNGDTVAIQPICKVNNFMPQLPPTIILRGETEVLSGEGTIDSPFEVR